MVLMRIGGGTWGVEGGKDIRCNGVMSVHQNTDLTAHDTLDKWSC